MNKKLSGKNLKLIIGVEAGLLLCVCMVAVGIFFYLRGTPGAPVETSSQPAAMEASATLAPTSVPPTEALPTEPPTVTPTPGPTGTLLEQLPDGSTKFTDYDAGYEITFPAGWLVVRPGSEEFQEALAKKTAKNADLKGMLEAAQDFDPQEKRVLAYDLKPGSLPTGVLGYIFVDWDPADAMTVEQSLSQGIPEVEKDPEYQGKGLRIVSTDTIENPNGLKIGRVGTKWNMKNSAGDILQIYMPINIFTVSQGMVSVTLTTPNDLRPDIEPDFKATVDGIKLLGQ